VDLGDILLILVFVVLPLLQQLMERLTKGAPRPPEEAGEEVRDLPPPEREPRPEPLPAPEAGRDAELPRGWEPWSAEAEEIAGREVVDEVEAAELTVLQSRLPAETVPEAVRVSVPVVSMEALRVDRTAKPAWRLEAPPPPDRRRRPARARAVLEGPGSLRRAVLLTEILGPPKGLD